MNIFDLLNTELPGDPVRVRLAVLTLVAISAFLWPRDMRRNWNTWTRKGRRVTMAILPVLMSNGLLLIAAAQRQDPIRVSVGVLAASFVCLNIALLLNFENDNSTDRQYEETIQRLAFWSHRTV